MHHKLLERSLEELYKFFFNELENGPKKMGARL